ncbi:alanine--tRNA ligase [Coxiella endosymbiont of Amblyomma sculptum]|nr:alanine--tRNA ligase [Coxiella endosymbiont of Amblyomma sculptum]
MNCNQLRQFFIEYFRKLDHEVVPSSSLVPTDDPTLLFTNSGMVQFKNVFLGTDVRSYQKAVSIQKCIRASGKHNDLESVGYTSRHHTFFEMLGNFSFKNYFKREAIGYTWRFLTEVLELPKKQLWVTILQGDCESESIWLREMKVDPKRLSRHGREENFWQMGDSGPCGPCTEIFYDYGPTKIYRDRRVEICNLVFMQYDKDLSGNLCPLQEPSVDTGMGLERLAAVTQGVYNNYDTELFQHLLKSLRALIGSDNRSASARVIVDHIRSATFLISDGVLPSNEGRGYVLRRIIRRALRHGYKLGQQEVFFYQMVSPLVKIMGCAYPELYKTQSVVEQTIRREEVQFSQTLCKGLKILDREMKKLPHRTIPGDVIFQLYDTYGFPPDLTSDIAKEHNFTMDYIGFNRAMESHRALSKKTQQPTVTCIRKKYR